ncbi:patatin-like phospholipase family protein [Candidatus Uabimicrobium sp. HlEnr_7]|uniref:patatin-like phospholipase family protein n=1 Tax=Candidatus Uabimicrobium helgolandensis TaxID=3095367 RepID=UPI003556FDBA
MSANNITLRDWLQQEKFSLAMSSGFFGFFAHCGIISVLEEEKLTPKRASGSSAGALITGCWGAGVAAKNMSEELFSLQREDFWDPSFGLGLLKGQLFDKRLRSFMPTTDFSKCRFPISISAYDAILQKTKVLESGDIVRAIRASCAVPLLFHPVWIKRKPFLDGGIRDHGGLKSIKKNERMFYHHLLPRKHNNKSRFFKRLPQKNNMVTLVLTSLPSVGPYCLENGRNAYNHAYNTMKKAMNTPIKNGKIII